MSIFKDLDSIISADQLNDLGIPSASIAILENGKITTHVITNGKEDANTVYQACSISKAITALAVARLVDEGRIAYDTRVVDHLSDSTFQNLIDADTRHLLQHVTVAMLLSHTAGLSQGGFPGYAGDPPSVEDTLAGRTPSNTPRVRIMNFPGAQWSYSGGGYIVLQLVLESIKKTPFAKLMEDVVLGPLNMTRSWYGIKPSDEKNYTKAYSTGSIQFPGELEYHNLAELAAAGLWTTPTDLLKAVDAVQGSLHTDSGFLKQGTAEKMLGRVTPSPPGMGMGLGWFLSDVFFGHGGTNHPGYNTYMGGARVAKNKEGDVMFRNGISIMTNSSLGHDAAIKYIASAVFYLKGWPRCEQLPSEYEKDNYVPYALPDRAKIGGQWRQWIGNWGPDWRLIDQDGFPACQFKSMEPMAMYAAAAPTQRLDDGKEVLFFVVRGLKLGLRLTWDEGVRAIRTLQEDSWGRSTESEPLKMI